MITDLNKTLILMHKNTPVAELCFVGNTPVRYGTVFSRQEIPTGTMGNNEVWQKRFLSEWYKSRAIPEVRPRLSEIEKKLGHSAAELFVQNAGISLTDCYWFSEPGTEICWEEVNFYQNGFDPVFAKIYGGAFFTEYGKSPDFTTDGVLEKYWIMPEDTPYLIKMDRKGKNILCANEEVFCRIAESVEVDTVRYTREILDPEQKVYGCICPSFIKDATEDMVTALQFKLEYRQEGLSEQRLLDFFADQMGFEKEIRQMMTLDCVLHNKDRHEKNFGLRYRDGEAVSFLPLYDNGCILGAFSAEYVLTSGALPRNTDADMQILPLKRSDILQEYGCELPLDYEKCLSIVRQVYERYEIPEILYELAERELTEGFAIYEEYLQTKSLGK